MNSQEIPKNVFNSDIFLHYRAIKNIDIDILTYANT